MAEDISGLHFALRFMGKGGEWFGT